MSEQLSDGEVVAAVKADVAALPELSRARIEMFAGILRQRAEEDVDFMYSVVLCAAQLAEK